VNIGDVQDALVGPGTLIPDDINVSEYDTSNLEHILVESNIPIHIAMYSLVILMKEDRIECETVDTSVFTSSKPSESRADYGYVVAFNFFFFSESVKFFTVVYHDTPSVFSFSEYLKLFSDCFCWF